MSMINLSRPGHGEIIPYGGRYGILYFRLEKMNTVEYTCLDIALQIYKKPVQI
jgi:hypothetical protein